VRVVTTKWPYDRHAPVRWFTALDRLVQVR